MLAPIAPLVLLLFTLPAVLLLLIRRGPERDVLLLTLVMGTALVSDPWAITIRFAELNPLPEVALVIAGLFPEITESMSIVNALSLPLFNISSNVEEVFVTSFLILVGGNISDELEEGGNALRVADAILSKSGLASTVIIGLFGPIDEVFNSLVALNTVDNKFWLPCLEETLLPVSCCDSLRNRLARDKSPWELVSKRWKMSEKSLELPESSMLMCFWLAGSKSDRKTDRACCQAGRFVIIQYKYRAARRAF